MSEISDVVGTVEITSLGAKGDGLWDGGAVPYALPGDIIEDGENHHALAPPGRAGMQAFRVMWRVSFATCQRRFYA